MAASMKFSELGFRQRQSHSHASESHLQLGFGGGPSGSQTTQVGATHMTLPGTHRSTQMPLSFASTQCFSSGPHCSAALVDAIGCFGISTAVGGLTFMIVLAGAALDPETSSLSEPVGESLAPHPVRIEANAAVVMTPAAANIAELNQIVFMFRIPFEV